ncbi:MAG: sugar transferase [Calditerrivibrio sp.]|nr:sugar transferase [Calditerrivibrio sp.]
MGNSFYKKHGKRLFDIIFSMFALVVLSPLFLVITLLIKMDSKGPVFYKQDRVGKDFKKFKLFKFRTMIQDADKVGPLVTAERDPRITKVGAFLRKWKLDELPQFFNVLIGDMSIVGPRPEVEKYVTLFIDEYKAILSIKPGITDYATLQYRNEEEIMAKYDDVEKGYIEEVLPKKIELYRVYIDDFSFITDLKIVFKTISRILGV